MFSEKSISFLNFKLFNNFKNNKSKFSELTKYLGVAIFVIKFHCNFKLCMRIGCIKFKEV